MKQIKRLFAIDPWKISTTQLDKNLRLQESLTSIETVIWGCAEL